MLRNTVNSYGSVAKWLHWLIVVWLLTAYAIIFSLNWGYGGEGPMRSPLITYHKAVGFSALILIAARIFWRATNPVPRHLDTMPTWQAQVSRLSHFLLYFFLLAMPVTGYLGNGTGVNYGLFHVSPFQDTSVGVWMLETLGITHDQWEVPFDTFHYRIVGPFVLWVLVLVHASAALYHHTILKDDVLKRMLPGNR